MSNSHITTVKDATGRIHEIPDIWIAGYCQGARSRGEPGEVVDAITAWLNQVWLEEHSND